MKGGVSYISKRHIKANNIPLNTYDPQQESKHIIYLDVSNLYGYAMYKFLQIGQFKSIDPTTFELNK